MNNPEDAICIDDFILQQRRKIEKDKVELNNFLNSLKKTDCTVSATSGTTEKSCQPETQLSKEYSQVRQVTSELPANHCEASQSDSTVSRNRTETYHHDRSLPGIFNTQVTSELSANHCKASKSGGIFTVSRNGTETYHHDRSLPGIFNNDEMDTVKLSSSSLRTRQEAYKKDLENQIEQKRKQKELIRQQEQLEDDKLNEKIKKTEEVLKNEFEKEKMTRKRLENEFEKEKMTRQRLQNRMDTVKLSSSSLRTRQEAYKRDLENQIEQKRKQKEFIRQQEQLQDEKLNEKLKKTEEALKNEFEKEKMTRQRLQNQKLELEKQLHSNLLKTQLEHREMQKNKLKQLLKPKFRSTKTSTVENSVASSLLSQKSNKTRKYTNSENVNFKSAKVDSRASTSLYKNEWGSNPEPVSTCRPKDDMSSEAKQELRRDTERIEDGRHKIGEEISADVDNAELSKNADRATSPVIPSVHTDGMLKKYSLDKTMFARSENSREHILANLSDIRRQLVEVQEKLGRGCS